MVFPSIGEFWCTQTYVLRPLVFLIKVKAKITIGIMIADTDMLVTFLLFDWQTLQQCSAMHYL